MNILSKKEVISRVLSENSADILLSAEELEAMLDKELSKPENEIDFGLVNELTAAVNEALGQNTSIDVEGNLAKLKAKEANEKRRFRLPKWSVGLVAACVMVMCANAVSVSAWNMNIFSFIVEFTKGGVTIDFNKNIEEIILPTSESDPYGIISKCEENGITADTPHYLPDGFILVRTEESSSEAVRTSQFMYRKGKQEIILTCCLYLNEIPKMGMASDKHNLSEITINGTQAIVSKEDNQMNFLYNREYFVLNIFTKDVDYTECEKIIQSIQ